MSKVNIGFVDGRSCSRILKPPGGGYSELFFTSNETDSSSKNVPEVKKTQSQLIIENMNEKPELKTEIKEEIKQEDIKCDEIKTEAENEIEEKIEETKLTKNEESYVEIKEEKHEIEHKMGAMKVKEEITPKRTRVPPGGYSSGLW